jgi:hypothetical protein
LGVKPARVTALLRGSNNFTLETMVRICRAIGAKYKHYIQAPGIVTYSYNALSGNLSTSASIIPASEVFSDFNSVRTTNLLSEYWEKALKSSAQTFPTCGHADLIKNHKRIEIPKIDADLALAA